MNTRQRSSDSEKQYFFQIPVAIALAVLPIPSSGLAVTRVGPALWTITWFPRDSRSVTAQRKIPKTKGRIMTSCLH